MLLTDSLVIEVQQVRQVIEIDQAVLRPYQTGIGDVGSWTQDRITSVVTVGVVEVIEVQQCRQVIEVDYAIRRTDQGSVRDISSASIPTCPSVNVGAGHYG